MELKQSQRTLLLFILVERIWSGRAKRILLILTYTLLIFALGAVAYSTGLHTKILDNVHVIPQVPLNFARGILAKPKHIVIDIRFEDFIKLAEQRELALAKGRRSYDKRQKIRERMERREMERAKRHR